MKIVIQRLTVAAALAVLVITSGSMASAQRGNAGFDTIVVFDDNAALDSFAQEYQADERENGNPDAWGYVQRDVKGAMQHLERQHGFKSTHAYSHALRGFAARLTARQIADLEADPLVAYVEEDGVMMAVEQVLPWGINRIDADLSSTLAGNHSGTISNVNVYIIDTGVYTLHRDLRVIRHVNFAGGPNADCNGHGTHVAGTVAAKDDYNDVVGVAPGAPITAVKVLGCNGSGTYSGVIQGIDWVTANAVDPAIANMSLGGGASSSVDQAVRNSANSGVFYSIAAGNSGANACNSSPARAGAGTNNGIMTTAATDSANKEASWSNYGSCVDIWAPGVSILSTRLNGGTTTLSGTSMAAPHVGGAGALYFSTHTTAASYQVEAALKAAATIPGTTSKNGAAIKLLNVRTF
jgi:subtilisin family serine protease